MRLGPEKADLYTDVFGKSLGSYEKAAWNEIVGLVGSEHALNRVNAIKHRRLGQYYTGPVTQQDFDKALDVELDQQNAIIDLATIESYRSDVRELIRQIEPQRRHSVAGFLKDVERFVAQCGAQSRAKLISKATAKGILHKQSGTSSAFVVKSSSAGNPRLTDRDCVFDNFHRNITTNVQNLSKVRPKGNWRAKSTPVEALLRSFQSRCCIRKCVKEECALKFTQPFNCLDIGSNLPLADILPTLLNEQRFQVLPRLGQALRARWDTENTKEINGGKISSESRRMSDFERCVAYCIWTQADSLTKPHHDIHGQGTWISCIAGLKLWFWWEDLSEDDWADFAARGIEWKGPPEKLRWSLLRPGDLLFMQAGRRVVHAVITLEDSLCYGGAFWDNEKTTDILQAIINEQSIQKTVTTNEENMEQLPDLLSEWRRQSFIDAEVKGWPKGKAEQVRRKFEEVLDIWTQKRSTRSGK